MLLTWFTLLTWDEEDEGDEGGGEDEGSILMDTQRAAFSLLWLQVPMNVQDSAVLLKLQGKH